MLLQLSGEGIPCPSGRGRRLRKPWRESYDERRLSSECGASCLVKLSIMAESSCVIHYRQLFGKPLMPSPLPKTARHKIVHYQKIRPARSKNFSTTRLLDSAVQQICDWPGFLSGSTVWYFNCWMLRFRGAKKDIMRVPLRTGRVLYTVAWAVSEGPHNLLNQRISGLLRSAWVWEDVERARNVREGPVVWITRYCSVREFHWFGLCVTTILSAPMLCKTHLASAISKKSIEPQLLQNSLSGNSICSVSTFL